MTKAHRFDVSLPTDMAEEVEQKIRSGQYASVDEMVIEGVRTLLERDSALERWLRDEVVKGHAEYLADPSKGVPVGQVLERIKARRAARPAS
jgi:putative addiction module CopG family antidote